jgi:hypothetical protein
MAKRNKIIYWVSTILLALAMLGGGFGQLFRARANVDVIIHLGYPVYFLSILGTWKVLGVVALLIPKFPLLKEWAYAGFFFAMTGAAVSHTIKGDGFAFIVPLIVALCAGVSWYFRPADRKIASVNAQLS